MMPEASVSLDKDNIAIPSPFEIASRERESHRIDVHRHDQTCLADNFPCERRARRLC